jgi:hypothetical protein
VLVTLGDVDQLHGFCVGHLVSLFLEGLKVDDAEILTV